MKEKLKYIIPLLAIGAFVSLTLVLQPLVNKSISTLKNEEIERTMHYAKKITKYIQDQSQGNTLTHALAQHPELRKKLNDLLQAFQNENVQNLFILSRDKKGRFRFVLDGSDDSPAPFNSVFLPRSQVFETAYRTQKAGIVEQQGAVESVWLSLLYPLVKDGQTQALLVLDLSEDFGKHILSFNHEISNRIRVMQFFVGTGILLLLYFLYRSSSIRKKMETDMESGARSVVYRQRFFDREPVEKYNFILLNLEKYRYILEHHSHKEAIAALSNFIRKLQLLLPRDAFIVRNNQTDLLIVLKKSERDFQNFFSTLCIDIQRINHVVSDITYMWDIAICGVALSDQTRVDYYTLASIMDKEILTIQSVGGNKPSLIQNISTEKIKYSRIEEIKKAIDNHQLCCLYQPIVDTSSKQIRKYESLIRMVDTTGDKSTLISPAFFIESIRETSHYIKMSHYVIERAFVLLEKHPEIEISVNVDLIDLYHGQMMESIITLLRKHKKNAKRLTFEILEYGSVEDFDRLDLIFRKLKIYGSKIAIDDFGSGYASFGHLAKLPFDIIKIDGGLISLVNENTRAEMIIELIVNFARKNNIELIAEFVSSKEIYEKLKTIGVPLAQGFYIGKPAQEEEIFPKEEDA